MMRGGKQGEEEIVGDWQFSGERPGYGDAIWVIYIAGFASVPRAAAEFCGHDGTHGCFSSFFGARGSRAV